LTRRRRFNWYDILLYVAAFCAYRVIQVATQSSLAKEPLPMEINIYLGFSIILLMIYWHKTRIKIPAEIKNKAVRAGSGWWASPQFDLPPIFVILTATIPQLAFRVFDEKYEYAAVISVGVVLYVLYRKYKGKLPSSGMPLSMMHVTSILAVLPGILMLNKPELLYNFGIVDYYTSRGMSFLLFLSSEGLLFYTALALSSYAWRNRTLINEGLDQKSFHDLQLRAMIASSKAGYNEELLNILNDVSYVNTLYREGNFGLVVAWGWGIFDRALPHITKSRGGIKDKAASIGLRTASFNKCYEIRVNTVHKGHKPDWRDAMLIIKELAKLLQLIIGINTK